MKPLHFKFQVSYTSPINHSRLTSYLVRIFLSSLQNAHGTGVIASARNHSKRFPHPFSNFSYLGCPASGNSAARTNLNVILVGIPSSGETLAALSIGVSLGQRSIILYTFVYKFISKLYYFNKIASSALLIITRLQIDNTLNLPTQPKRQKAQSLKDILLKLRLITSVSYDLF